jgi:hypothetical protein
VSEQPITTGDNGAGWYGLLGLLQSGREIRREFRERDPVACPHCGEPVRAGGEDGTIFCRFDGWRWDGSVEDAQPRNR